MCSELLLGLTVVAAVTSLANVLASNVFDLLAALPAGVLVDETVGATNLLLG